jgi:hypothetical protein
MATLSVNAATAVEKTLGLVKKAALVKANSTGNDGMEIHIKVNDPKANGTYSIELLDKNNASAVLKSGTLDSIAIANASFDLFVILNASSTASLSVLATAKTIHHNCAATQFSTGKVKVRLSGFLGPCFVSAVAKLGNDRKAVFFSGMDKSGDYSCEIPFAIV